MEYKLLHTCIRVLDLEKSIDFYERTFGFKETKRIDNPEHEFTLVYLSDADGLLVGLVLFFYEKIVKFVTKL